jgi:hypothetical protein
MTDNKLFIIYKLTINAIVEDLPNTLRPWCVLSYAAFTCDAKNDQHVPGIQGDIRAVLQQV